MTWMTVVTNLMRDDLRVRLKSYGLPSSSGVYQIQNIKNKKVYVGSSCNIRSRIQSHFKMLEVGNHHSHKLQRSYNRSACKDIFVPSVIELVDDVSHLKEREQEWIDRLDAYNSGYNCSALSDNPKYTTKKSTKAKNKEKGRLAYDRFWEVYDEERVKAGYNFMFNVREQLYKPTTIHSISSLLEFATGLYASKDYSFSVGYKNGYAYVDVYGADQRRFVEYGWRNNNPYVGKEMTDLIRYCLAKDGTLDESLHAILPCENIKWI